MCCIIGPEKNDLNIYSNDQSKRSYQFESGWGMKGWDGGNLKSVEKEKGEVGDYILIKMQIL